MDLEKIHAYIGGKLQGSQLDEFEQALSNDEGLKKEVYLQKQMLRHHLDQHDIDPAIKAIQEVHKIHIEDNATQKRPIKIWLAIAIAASLALFIVVRYSSLDPTNDQLFNQYYSTPVASFAVKGSSIDDELVKAEIAYNQGDYNMALAMLTEISRDSLNVSGQILFYQAQSMIGLEDYQGALEKLEELRSIYSQFTADSDWYRALIYLKISNEEEALTILKSITDANYIQRVQDIIRKIE